MSKITPKIFFQKSPKSSKKFIDRWFVASLVFFILGLAMAALALFLLPKM